MLKNKLLWIITFSILLTVGCRYDMQDQPRYKVYKKSDWFSDGRASRELPEGTIPRGYLRDNVALYTGKLEGVTAVAQTNAQGQQTTFPDKVADFPIPVTQEILDRGQEKYKVYCSICHGAFGNGDGMIVRRGFPKPPSYNDDRLRNAPVGHFFDVATNGWGKMSGYASQVSVADRWAIVAYIKALQVSQNPNLEAKTTTTGSANTATNTSVETKTVNTNTTVNTNNSNTNTSSNVNKIVSNTAVKTANTNANGGKK